MYIRQLSKEAQALIIDHLTETGFMPEDIQNALDSKVTDVVETLSEVFPNGFQIN